MLPPRFIVPFLLIIAAGAISIFVWLETLGERSNPWKFGDPPRRPASPESQVGGIILFLAIIIVAKDFGAFGK